MIAEKDLFIRQRFENKLEIWDVAENSVISPKYAINIEKYSSKEPIDTQKAGFWFYPKGSELPIEYENWLESINQKYYEV